MALRLRARHGGVKVIPLVPRGPMVIVVLLVALFCLFFGLSELYEASGPATGASLWREQALALALLAFGLHLLWLIFRTARQEVRIGPSTLSVWLRGRHFEAAWTEIADITDHDVPYWQRNEGNQPRITIRLHAPSGAPLDWLTIPDAFEIGRAELTAELRAGLEAAPRPATMPRTYATASIVIARRDHMLMRFGAIVALAPVLIGLLFLIAAWLG
jgi:hypothetical protein